MLYSTAQRYFLETIQAGSFRAAAERLHVAPSALSRQVHLLEEEIGAPLLERTRGRTPLRLTAAGEILVRAIRAGNLEIERGQSEIEALRGLRRGRVRLGISETLARDLLPALLGEFRRKHARVVFEVTVTGAAAMNRLLRDDEIDLAIAYNPVPAREIQWVAAHKLEAGLIVRPDHPLAKRAAVKLRELSEIDFVLPDHTLALRALLEDMFARGKLKPQCVFSSNSFEMLRNAVLAGFGAALQHRDFARAEINSGALVFIPLRDPRIGAQRVVCAVREGRHLPAAAAVLVEMLRLRFAGLFPR